MKIQTIVPLNNGLWAHVDAELLFDLAPHVSDVATFMVHLDPRRLSSWSVSSVETGLWVAQGDDRREVIERARKRLAEKDSDDFRTAYREAFKVYKQLENGAR